MRVTRANFPFCLVRKPGKEYKRNCALILSHFFFTLSVFKFNTFPNKCNILNGPLI